MGKKEVKVLKLKKRLLYKFLNAVAKEYDVYAPVKTDLVRFERYSGQEIYLKQNSYFPIKEFFFKKEETLFDFSGSKITIPQKKIKKRVFFGVRRCDLNAVKHQDGLFLETYKDSYYKQEREGSLLIGYHCNKPPSSFCFCGSMELEDFHDLMFFDRKDYFLVESGSEKGRKLLKKHRNLFMETEKTITGEDKKIPDSDNLQKKEISNLYNHPDWKKGINMCIGCGACTAVCPTCYCFSMHDETDISNLKKGKRKRTWSSCQLKEFTKVAGGHVFREKRGERFKHRIYHQVQYFRERYGINLCTGCGRCISGCPTRIDWVKILNEMK